VVFCHVSSQHFHSFPTRRSSDLSPHEPAPLWWRQAESQVEGLAMDVYLKAPISNGNPREQALIRRWWCEQKASSGLLVWEYCLEGRYLDGVWFANDNASCEMSGLNAPLNHPIRGQRVVLCEAKITLTPELVGQALVYRQFALRAGACVEDTIVFCERASASMIEVAQELGLSVAVGANQYRGVDAGF